MHKAGVDSNLTKKIIFLLTTFVIISVLFVVFTSDILISDKIDTECELIEFLIQPKNQANVFLTIQEHNQEIELHYFDRGGKIASTAEETRKAHSLMRQISAEIIVVKYEIDPKLTYIVLNTLYGEGKPQFMSDMLRGLNIDCNSQIIDYFIKK